MSKLGFIPKQSHSTCPTSIYLLQPYANHWLSLAFMGIVSLATLRAEANYNRYIACSVINSKHLDPTLIAAQGINVPYAVVYTYYLGIAPRQVI
jgi:hypothetical protein